MAKGGSPSAPAAPDPVKTIQAQAKATPSVTTPYGSATYSGDPATGTYKLTQGYSEAIQPRFESANRLATTLLGQGEDKVSGLAEPFQFDPNNPVSNQYWTAQKNLLEDVFGRQTETLDQKLANQGIPIGSEAYSDATGDLARQQNQAYEQASANALDKGFSQQLASRQQLASEIAQAMQQGAPPGVTGAPQNQVDINEALAAEQSGLNRAYQGQLASHNADVATTNQAVGSAASIAALALLLSDERAKTNVKRVGETDAGVPIYTYNYKFGGPTQMGVMAQELEQENPEAVHTIEGVKFVDYEEVE